MSTVMRYLLDPQFVVMVLAAVAAFATVASLVMPLLSGDRLGPRMKYVASERERDQIAAANSLNRKQRVLGL